MTNVIFIISVIVIHFTKASTAEVFLPVSPEETIKRLPTFMAANSQITGTHILKSTCGVTCEICQCYSTLENNTKEMILVDCRSTNMTKIPTLPGNTTALDLSFNKIRNVKNITTTVYVDLIFLSLANNGIEKITDNYLKMFPNLKLLDLSLNKIRYFNIHSLAFISLKQLLFLDIKQDFQDDLTNESYPDQALSELTQLQTLVIDGLHQQEPGRGFFKLIKLRELFMSGTYGRCNISVLNQSFFKFVNTVENFSLYLANCSLRAISDETFKNIQHLTALDISWNVDMNFDSMENLTHGLNNTSIKFLNFNGLQQHSTLDCTTLKDNHIKYMTNTSVIMILYESNHIISVAVDAYKYFPQSIQYLSLRDNLMVNGEYAINLMRNSTLSNLLYYDTAQMFKNHDPNYYHTNYTTFDQNSLDEQKHSTIIYIHYNDFKKRCQIMFRQKRQINSFDIILSRIEKINYIRDDNTRKLVSLFSQELNSYWMHRHDLVTKSSKQGEIEYLDISENVSGVTYRAFYLFGNITKLKFLNASNNFNGYPTLTNKENVFLNYTSLKMLDLSANQIWHIKPNTFENLINLEKLYLANNRLTNTDDCGLMSTKKLNYLSLKNNYLDTVSETVRYKLELMENLTINIANNTLKCGCEDKEFLNWLKTSKVHFEELDQYVCKFDNTSEIFMKDFSHEAFNAECSPSTYDVIIIVTSLCLLTFFIILLVGLAYRYKWNLRYLYYMTKFKLINGYQQIRNDDTEFDKDVFVSYANEDRGFVRQHVVSRLETIGKINLLVHDRDFEAGQYVADNIMKAVTNSRKTLVILTQAYIESKWCLYEMNMARLEGIDTGRNVLCVMLKEDIPTKHLPLEIMDIIRKKTYIEYPQEEEHLDGFWERLIATLRS